VVRPHLTGMKRYVERQLRARSRDGFATLEDVYGRRFTLAEEDYYKGFVTLIQGCEASMFKQALLSVYGEVSSFNEETGGDNASVLYTIHDEIEVECRIDTDFVSLKRKVQTAMESEGSRFRVPFAVDVSYSTRHWADANYGAGGRERRWTSDEAVLAEVRADG
ncbi:MAG TPA: DNA polymerase, partial [Thermoleophilia bacterium]|nr:DNA polymerase [Thermoleophilia bacterium]